MYHHSNLSSDSDSARPAKTHNSQSIYDDYIKNRNRVHFTCVFIESLLAKMTVKQRSKSSISMSIYRQTVITSLESETKGEMVTGEVP